LLHEDAIASPEEGNGPLLPPPKGGEASPLAPLQRERGIASKKEINPNFPKFLTGRTKIPPPLGGGKRGAVTPPEEFVASGRAEVP